MNSPVDQAIAFSTLSMVCWLLLQIPVLARALRRLQVIGSQHPRICYGIVFLWAVTLCASLGALHGLPEPKIHDEFSYLLSGETLAGGRLANPAHPHWQHFEAMHVLQQPTYASKYPLGQGVALAMGFYLGHPIFGVWLSLATACAATCWMLRAWLSPQWALLASFIAATRLCTSDYPIEIQQHAYWSQSYWGGAVAALGGALLFGGLRRIARTPQWQTALAMAIGIFILAHSRPLEGLVVTAACLPMFIWQLWKRSRQEQLRTVSVVVVVMLANVVLLAAHAQAVTGSFWKLPYSLYEQTYSLTHPTLLLPLRKSDGDGAPEYRNPEMKNFHVGWEGAEFARQLTSDGYWNEKTKRALGIWQFFVGPTLTLPLLFFLLFRKSTWLWFSLLVGLLLAFVQSMTPWLHPHYWAPLAAVVYLWIGSGLAGIAKWLNGSKGFRYFGTDVAHSLAMAAMLSMLISALPTATATATIESNSRQSWHLRRAAVEQELVDIATKTGELQLVIVRYAFNHNVHEEWVYNHADIDRASVVWARDRGNENHRLLEYFGMRHVWFLYVQGNTAELIDSRGSRGRP